MELRLVSDPLMKYRMSPLLSFLTPSVPPLWRSTAASPQLRLLISKSPRCTSPNFHTTARQRADSSSTAADLDFLEDKPRPQPRQMFPTSSSQRRPTDDVIRNSVDSILGSTFPSNSPSANPAKRKPSEPVDESSAALIQNAYQNSVRNATKYYQEPARRMLFPPQEMTGPDGRQIVSRDASRILENTQKISKRAVRTVRSRPAVGRTIEVIPEKGVDFGRALRNLDISCSLNRVRLDSSRQRFHERPGLKRKRLKSERWRKMFKASFRATVRRVREMRRKGW